VSIHVETRITRVDEDPTIVALMDRTFLPASCSFRREALTISELSFNTYSQNSAPKDIDIACPCKAPPAHSAPLPGRAVRAKGDIGQSVES
jgi:hypothetical protein